MSQVCLRNFDAGFYPPNIYTLRDRASYTPLTVEEKPIELLCTDWERTERDKLRFVFEILMAADTFSDLFESDSATHDGDLL